MTGSMVAVSFQSILNGGFNFFHVEWFPEVFVDNSFIQGISNFFTDIKTGQDKEQYFREILFGSSYKFNAVHAGHFHVTDNHSGIQI